MKYLPKIPPHLRWLTLGLAVLSAAPLAQATPYASCITNTAGTISFYLNEAGGTVVVTYEDSSTNANFNGITTGLNQSAGLHSFSLVGHTSYAIAVSKIGSGSPSLITSVSRSNSRGVDVNKNPSSPYFGRVYSVQSLAGLFMNNSDLSVVNSAVTKSGVNWATTGSTTSPYRIAVTGDDYILAGDASPLHAGVWRLDPNLTTNQTIFNPVGYTNALAAGVLGTVQSRPLLIGSFEAGTAVLMDVDGDLPSPNGYNSLMIYNIGSNPFPWTNPPSIFGPQVGVGVSSILGGLGGATSTGNEYPGLTQGPNGYIYASTYRINYSNPLLQIYDSSGTVQLWNSYYTAANGSLADYFVHPVSGIAGNSTQGIVDAAVSPDGAFVVGVGIDNDFTIIPLQDGIPNVANLFIVPPTSTSGNARGIAWDAADNIYLSSSGIGAVQEWSLGLSATAITTGNASGPTGFQLITPANQVSVVATVPFATQGGSNGTIGTPVAGDFTITRTSTNGYDSPLLVNFTLTGTAPGAAYTSTATNSVVIPAGQQSVDVFINPSTANVPRTTLAVKLSLTGGGSYTVAAPFSDTVLIQNTSSQQLQVISGGATSVYNAFSNDFASVVVQRLGDTNAPSYTMTGFTNSGSAILGTDFLVGPLPTFNPGDLTQTNYFYPLIAGQPPVHTTTRVYVGNKTATIGLASGGSSYSTAAATTAFTIVDSAEPPIPVLYANQLTDPNDAINWKITFAGGDTLDYPADYNVDFGYDLTANNPNSSVNGVIPVPPNGATNALRITANKLFNPGAAGAVNVYLTNHLFGGDFAARFNMNFIRGANPNYTTEGPVFGINHTGSQSNWWYGSGPLAGGPWGSDGIWYWISADAGGASAGDYIEFTGAGGTNGNAGWQILTTQAAGTFSSIFKQNPGPFTSGGGAGLPANGSPQNSLDDSTWTDVEIKQIHNVVTLSIDKTAIFTYTNTTVWTNGFLMLGYADPFGGSGGLSVGTPDAAAYYANLRVVSLAGPTFTAWSRTGTNTVLTFTSADGDDTTASFALQGAKAVSGPYTDVTPAPPITQLSTAAFQVTTGTNAAAQFYRIRHK